MTELPAWSGAAEPPPPTTQSPPWGNPGPYGSAPPPAPGWPAPGWPTAGSPSPYPPPSPPPRRRGWLLASTLVVVLVVLSAVVFLGGRSTPTASTSGGSAPAGTPRASRPSVPSTLPAPEPPPAQTIPAGMTGPQRQAVDDALFVGGKGCFGSGWYTGTGWPIDTDHLMTAAHVVGGSTEVQIRSTRQPERRAIVVAIDDDVDVAVLYVPGAHFTALGLHGGPPPAPGQSMVTVGFHNDAERVVTATYDGPTTTLDDFPAAGTEHTVNEFSGDIREGFSGGPIIDRSGQVEGMMIEGSPGIGDAVTVPDLSAAEAAGTLRAPVYDGPCVNVNSNT